MLESVAFVSGHLLGALLLTLALLVVGRALVVFWTFERAAEYLFVTVTLGAAAFTLIWFLLAAVQVYYLPVLLVVGGLMASVCAWQARWSLQQDWRSGVWRPPMVWLLPFLALVAVVLLPALYPPIIADGVAYHLPYARWYAEHHGLQVEPALRFPLHPHNPHLWYALALMLGSDSLAQLMHGGAAVLTALGVMAIGQRLRAPAAGYLGAFFFLLSPAAGWLAGTAYVDHFVALGGTAAFYFWLRWYQDANREALWLCALALGLAAGTKYAALLLLLLFPLLCILARRWRAGLFLLAMSLLFAAPWYVRSFVIMGNPMPPLFADHLGLLWWSLNDVASINQDVASSAGAATGWLGFLTLPWTWLTDTPNPAFAPFRLIALAFPAMLIAWRWGRDWMILTVLCAAFTVLWFINAPHLRYLFAVLPLLALLAAQMLVAPGRWLVWRWPRLHHLRPARWVVAAVLCGAGGWFLFDDLKQDPLPMTSQQRQTWLQQHLPGKEFVDIINRSGEGVYRFGFPALEHYLSPPSMGDWVGTGRYRDVMRLFSRPSELAGLLDRWNLRWLLIQQPFDLTVELPREFDCHFQMEAQTDEGQLHGRWDAQMPSCQ